MSRHIERTSDRELAGHGQALRRVTKGIEMTDMHSTSIEGTGSLLAGESAFPKVGYSIKVSEDGHGSGIISADFMCLIGARPGNATLHLACGNKVAVHLNQIFLNEHLAHVTTLGHRTAVQHDKVD